MAVTLQAGWNVWMVEVDASRAIDRALLLDNLAKLFCQNSAQLINDGSCWVPRGVSNVEVMTFFRDYSDYAGEALGVSYTDTVALGVAMTEAATRHYGTAPGAWTLVLANESQLVRAPMRGKRVTEVLVSFWWGGGSKAIEYPYARQNWWGAFRRETPVDYRLRAWLKANPTAKAQVAPETIKKKIKEWAKGSRKDLGGLAEKAAFAWRVNTVGGAAVAAALGLGYVEYVRRQTRGKKPSRN